MTEISLSAMQLDALAATQGVMTKYHVDKNGLHGCDMDYTIGFHLALAQVVNTPCTFTLDWSILFPWMAHAKNQQNETNVTLHVDFAKKSVRIGFATAEKTIWITLGRATQVFSSIPPPPQRVFKLGRNFSATHRYVFPHNDMYRHFKTLFEEMYENDKVRSESLPDDDACLFGTMWPKENGITLQLDSKSKVADGANYEWSMMVAGQFFGGGDVYSIEKERQGAIQNEMCSKDFIELGRRSVAKGRQWFLFCRIFLMPLDITTTYVYFIAKNKLLFSIHLANNDYIEAFFTLDESTSCDCC